MEPDVMINEPLTQEEIQIEEDTSISNQVIDLIRRKYDIVENYNNLKSVLMAQGRDDLSVIIEELLPAEVATIGVLTNMLVETQPNVALDVPAEVEIIPEI